jgi:hypothetical protein
MTKSNMGQGGREKVYPIMEVFFILTSFHILLHISEGEKEITDMYFTYLFNNT